MNFQFTAYQFLDGYIFTEREQVSNSKDDQFSQVQLLVSDKFIEEAYVRLQSAKKLQEEEENDGEYELF